MNQNPSRNGLLCTEKFVVRTDGDELHGVGAFVIEDSAIIARYVNASVSDILAVKRMIVKKRMESVLR